MDYNTSKEFLKIREYGRNVQNLVNYAKTIEDRKERTRVAKYIIELMSQLNPQYKNIDEYRQKLWDHLYYISNFELDVDSPFPMPDPNEFIKIFKQNDRMEYPMHDITYRHYGKNVESMVKKASNTEDPEKQKAFAEVIGNFMKLAYNNWNHENVTDEVIIADLKRISNGELKISSEDTDLDSLSKSTRKRSNKKSSHRNNNSGYKKNYKRRNYRNN